MTVFEEMSESATAAVNRWLVKEYRESGDDAHLRTCAGLALADVEGRDSTYGCDTGCEYVRLAAVASCPHGVRDDFDYGQFGDLSSVLEDILIDEGEVEAPRLERPVFQVTGSQTIPTGVWTQLLGSTYEVLQYSGVAVPLRWIVTRTVGDAERLLFARDDGRPAYETSTPLAGAPLMISGSCAFPTPAGWTTLHYRGELAP